MLYTTNSHLLDGDGFLVPTTSAESRSFTILAAILIGDIPIFSRLTPTV